MKGLNNTKKSRLKMSIYTIVFLSLLSICCIVVMIKSPELDLTSVVSTCVAGVLTIATMYIGGDSFRKSD